MIVVAGGTGFIGRAIVAELSRRGERVAEMSHSVRSVVVEIAGQTLELRRGDVRDVASLEGALAGADTVVGAVQFPGFPNENSGKGFTFENIDHQGTVHLVEAARRIGVKRYVYISGAGAAPAAGKVWFRAKWGAETAVRESGARSSRYSGRPGCMDRWIAPKPVRWLHPRTFAGGPDYRRRQATGAAGVCGGCGSGCSGQPERRRTTNGVYEIGGPEVHSMNEVVRTAELALGKPKPLVHQPVWLMKLLFSPKALFPTLPLPLTPAGVEFATMDALADNAALWRPSPSFG